MKPRLCTLPALAACCLLLLGGCRDRHEPTKPTVLLTGSASFPPTG